MIFVPEILLNTDILKTSTEQRHIRMSERMFHCFASCMCVNNTQKYLNGIEVEETCFHASLSPALYTPFINLSGLIFLILLSFLFSSMATRCIAPYSFFIKQIVYLFLDVLNVNACNSFVRV